jgi:hypothetical protein
MAASKLIGRVGGAVSHPDLLQRGFGNRGHGLRILRSVPARRQLSTRPA